jgi:hypothetical protein
MHMLASHITKLAAAHLTIILATNLHDNLFSDTSSNPPLIYAVQTHADHCLVLQLLISFWDLVFQTKRTFGILSSDLASSPPNPQTLQLSKGQGVPLAMCCRVRDHVLGFVLAWELNVSHGEANKIGAQADGNKLGGWKFWKDLKILALFADGIGALFFYLDEYDHY